MWKMTETFQLNFHIPGNVGGQPTNRSTKPMEVTSEASAANSLIFVCAAGCAASAANSLHPREVLCVDSRRYFWQPPLLLRRYCAATAPLVRRYCAATAPLLSHCCAATAPLLRR